MTAAAASIKRGRGGDAVDADVAVGVDVGDVAPAVISISAPAPAAAAVVAAGGGRCIASLAAMLIFLAWVGLPVPAAAALASGMCRGMAAISHRLARCRRCLHCK